MDIARIVKKKKKRKGQKGKRPSACFEKEKEKVKKHAVVWK